MGERSLQKPSPGGARRSHGEVGGRARRPVVLTEGSERESGGEQGEERAAALAPEGRVGRMRNWHFMCCPWEASRVARQGKAWGEFIVAGESGPGL